MRQKTLARLYDPNQRIFTGALQDPYRPSSRKPLGTPALHNEIRRRLMVGEAVDSAELARHYLVDEPTADRAIAYEDGRLFESSSSNEDELEAEIRRRMKIGAPIRVAHLSRKFGISEANTERAIEVEHGRAIHIQRWQEAMSEQIREVAGRLEYFSADDVFAEMPEEAMPDGRRFGPLMLKAVKAGICEKTDRHILSVRPANHGRPIRLWRSLIWRSLPEGD